MAYDRRPLAGLRVLIVEDELVIAMLLEDMLEELGAEIVGTVNSVADAVGTIAATDPDAATLDVNLDGRRNYAAATALRERSIPFIFVSGYTTLPDCPPAYRDVPRVPKPFRVHELVAAFEAALPQLRVA